MHDLTSLSGLLCNSIETHSVLKTTSLLGSLLRLLGSLLRLLGSLLRLLGQWLCLETQLRLPGKSCEIICTPFEEE
jgi:hypothetical protein